LALCEARGSPSQNIAYCSKEGSMDFYEFGCRPLDNHKKIAISRKRNRDDKALAIVKFLDEGNSQDSCFKKFPGDFLYSGRVIMESYYRMRSDISRDNIKVLFLVGPTGCGKSRLAHEMFPKAYIKNPRTKWWHNYQLQSDVIIDDLGKNCIDITYLLNWFDRYRCNVETKGGNMSLHAVRFIVTTNFSNTELFTEEVYDEEMKRNVKVAHPQIPALERRCSFVHYYLHDDNGGSPGFYGTIGDVRVLGYKYPQMLNAISKFFGYGVGESGVPVSS